MGGARAGGGDVHRLEPPARIGNGINEAAFEQDDLEMMEPLGQVEENIIVTTEHVDLVRQQNQSDDEQASDCLSELSFDLNDLEERAPNFVSCFPKSG